MDDYNEKLRKMEKTLSEWNIDRAKRFVDDPANTAPRFSDSITLPNTGAEGYKDDVVKDHVFASQVLTGEMYKQLELCRALQAELKKIQDRIGDEEIVKRTITAFVNALCTGAVYMSKDDKYTFMYLKGDFDFPDEYTLTNMDTKPYGDMLPIYSAFVQFMNLDQEDKDDIAERAKKIKRENEEDCLAFTKKIKDYLEKRVDLLKEIADESFRSERKAIYEFIKLAVSAIRTFERSLLM